MQLLILLSAHGLDFLDFEAIDFRQVRLAVIVEEHDPEHIPNELKAYCAAIETINGSDFNGPVVALDPQATEQALQAIVDRFPNDQVSVVSFSEMNVILAADLSSRYGKAWASAEQLLPYRDKVKMKNQLRQADIAMPAYTEMDAKVVDVATYYADLVAQLGSPFIVKPVSSAGSYGVAKIADETAFLSWWQTQADFQHFDYEAEQFIQGDLYHCDMVIKAGQVLFSAAAAYSIPNMLFCQNHILGSMVLQDDDPLAQQLKMFATGVHQALGMLNGASHMEIFVDATGKMTFLEVGARPPGAMALRMYRYSYNGYRIANATLDALADIPYQHQAERKGDSFWAFVPKVEGVVKQCHQPECHGNIEIQWLVEPGMSIQTSQSVADYAAKMVARYQDYPSCCRDFQALKAAALLTVEPV